MYGPFVQTIVSKYDMRMQSNSVVRMRTTITVYPPPGLDQDKFHDPRDNGISKAKIKLRQIGADRMTSR